MSDPSQISAIQSWIANVESSFASVPNTIQQDSASGDFSSILSTLQALVDPASATTAASSSSATASDLGAQATGQQALLTGALSSEASAATGSSIVSGAEQYLGVPYVWGGSSPSGFDCSGLVQYVFTQQGVSLPRTAAEQAQVGTPVASLAEAQPGDLVFFPGSDGTATSPGHVGIYIGNGEMIDAPETGENVQIQPVGNPSEIRDVLSSTSATSTALTTSTADVDDSSISSVPQSSLADVPATLAPLFQASAAKYGVPVSLLEAVAQTESNFNPNATSSAGAEGLMQLMPSTAAGIGVDPFDPAQAIDGAAQLLSSYLSTYHSTPLALAAYNAGPAAVAQYGGVPPYPQTEDYVQSIMNEIGATS